MGRWEIPSPSHCAGWRCAHQCPSSGVSSDLAVSSQRAGPLPLVSAHPEEDLPSFPRTQARQEPLPCPAPGSPAPAPLAWYELFVWSHEELLNLSGQAHSPSSELRAVPAGLVFPAVPRDVVRVARWQGQPCSQCSPRGGGLVSLSCAVQVSADVWGFFKHVAMGVSVLSIKQ